MFSGLTGWHLLLFSPVPFVLWIIALVQIARSRAAGGTIAVWIVIVTLLPLVGPIVWFVVGKRTASKTVPLMPVGIVPVGAVPAGAVPVDSVPVGAVPAVSMPAAVVPVGVVPVTAEPDPAADASAETATDVTQPTPAPDTTEASPPLPAGWYPSPSYAGLRQWWDGSQWTNRLEGGPANKRVPGDETCR